MSSCGACAGVISGTGVPCDGVCGHIFHAACLKRGSRSSGSTTCPECSEIKPCHILRLVKGITDTFSTDLTLVAEKVNSLYGRWADFGLLSDDTNTLIAKVDRLIDVVGVLEAGSGVMLERSHELSARVAALTSSLDDVQASLVGFDPGLVSSAGSSPLLPLIDDIRRSVKQVKGDLNSWSSTVTANSDALSSIASDVRALSVRCEVLTVPPSSGTVELDRSATPPAAVSGCPHASVSTPEAVLPLAPVLGGSRGSSGLERVSTHRRRGRRRRAPRGSTATSGTVDVERTTRPVGTAPHTASVESAGPSARPGAVGLRPARQPKCVFISRVHPDTSEREIIDHISSQLDVPDNMVACRRISPAHGADGRAFTASFKIFVPEDAFSAVVSPEIWPSGAIVREFVPKARPSPTPHSKNLSARSPSVIPT